MTVPAPSSAPAGASVPAYATSCPTCGAQLDPVALAPPTAPWLCPVVHPGLRGYWAAELSDAARALFRPRHADFGFGHEGRLVRGVVLVEARDAFVRGISLREDQLRLARPAVLNAVKLRAGVHPAFLALVDAALTAKGA